MDQAARERLADRLEDPGWIDPSHGGFDDCTGGDSDAEAVVRLESPFTLGGFKGMGEGGAIAPGAVIANAVADALRPFGRVQIDELPITPERVLRAIQAAQGKGTPPS